VCRNMFSSEQEAEEYTAQSFYFRPQEIRAQMHIAFGHDNRGVAEVSLDLVYAGPRITR